MTKERLQQDQCWICASSAAYESTCTSPRQMFMKKSPVARKVSRRYEMRSLLLRTKVFQAPRTADFEDRENDHK